MKKEIPQPQGFWMVWCKSEDGWEPIDSTIEEDQNGAVGMFLLEYSYYLLWQEAQKDGYDVFYTVFTPFARKEDAKKLLMERQDA